MRANFLERSVLLWASLIATCGVTSAHGGQYRGPGSVTPPTSSGSSGSAGGGASSPGPSSGPSTPNSSGGGGAAPTPSSSPTAPSTTASSAPKGVQVGPDLSRWQFWWEFHKDPFLNLKAAVHQMAGTVGSDEFFMAARRDAIGRDSLKPTERDVVERVIPHLKQALASTTDRDITSGCLIALGKIGKDHDTFKTLDLMRPFLKSADLEIRGAAALAMGITQMTDAIPDLTSMVEDTPAGRQLCGRSEVDDYTRSFACYGLGLIAWANADVDVKRRCFEPLRKLLAMLGSDRNAPIAAIQGVRLMRPARDGTDKDRALLADCLAVLSTVYERSLGVGDQLIQSHVPPAIATLLGRGGDKTGRFKAMFARELDRKDKRTDVLLQSAVVALGVLCEAPEINAADAAYSALLLRHYQEARDAQTRYFCLMALARIGGERNRAALLAAFANGNKGLEKPWAALALGVLTFGSTGGDAEIGRTLHAGLQEVRNPETQAALAVALGLSKYRDATDDLLALLQKYKSNDELAGYVCIGLGLMGDPRAIMPISDLARDAVRRPDLLKQAAIALGKLGDKAVADLLQHMLKDEHGNVAKLSAVASALGFIGDRRTIDTLAAMLGNEAVTPLSRAFAAVALGAVADKEPMPWNSKIAIDINYRAAVDTLTNGATGVLDIL